MADENYVDLYNDTESGKEGTMVAGRDVILLDAPEVLLSPDTPLLTNAQDVAGAINELFSSGGEGGDDDWQPPEGWIDIPEPEAYQVTMLVDTYFTKTSVSITLTNETGTWSASGAPTIDWGDGTVTVFEPRARGYSHTYDETGQYIITVTGAENENIIYFTSASYENSILAIKIGTSMGITGSNTDYFVNLVYLKFKGRPRHEFTPFNFQNAYSLICVDFESGYPYDGDFRDSAFQNCYSLKKAPFTRNLKRIPAQMFQNCRSLESVDLSSAVTVEGSTFFNCHSVKKINAPLLENLSRGEFYACYSLLYFSAPKLTLIDECFRQCDSLKEVNTPLVNSVSLYSFTTCYQLQKFIYADGCDFNGNTFSSCPQLYPKPE